MSAVRWMSTREQQLAKQRVAVSRNDYILAFGEVFETSLTFWDSINSFSVRFAILLTLCHTLGPSNWYSCFWSSTRINNYALCNFSNSTSAHVQYGGFAVSCKSVASIAISLEN